MHTTTKKNLGRSTRAGVIGRSSVSSPLCAGCIARALLAHTRRTRTRTVSVWPCVLLGQRVVQTRVYQRGTLLPWTRSKLPVRHFVSAILFARYLAGYLDLDALRSLRYLFVCAYSGPSSIAAQCLANSDELAGRQVEILARRVHAGIMFSRSSWNRTWAMQVKNELKKFFVIYYCAIYIYISPRVSHSFFFYMCLLKNAYL